MASEKNTRQPPEGASLLENPFSSPYIGSPCAQDQEAFQVQSPMMSHKRKAWKAQMHPIYVGTTHLTLSLAPAPHPNPRPHLPPLAGEVRVAKRGGTTRPQSLPAKWGEVLGRAGIFVGVVPEYAIMKDP